MGVKVADFGLSRDIYMTNYYVMSQKVPLPVKWLAPEALLDKVFSEKTDVVSFSLWIMELFISYCNGMLMYLLKCTTQNLCKKKLCS